MDFIETITVSLQILIIFEKRREIICDYMIFRFFCELCQVAATSQDQLDMHFNGAKHKKAEKAAGGGAVLSTWKSAPATAPIPPPGNSLFH